MAALKWQISLSMLDCSPHRVTLWGSAGYFERLVAHCCWHICVTLLEIWEKCGLAFQAHWKHPGPVSNHSWCGNTVSCAIIWYNSVFGISEPCMHKPIHKYNRGNKEVRATFQFLANFYNLQEKVSVWGSPVLFGIESQWAHYANIFLFYLYRPLKTSA